jgi:hypothetical protein
MSPYPAEPMDEILSTLFSLPTLPWTCLVLASVVYWLTVIAGALDLDVLGGAEGKASGDAGLEHVAGSHEGVLTSLLSALKLRSVPLTITLSFLGLFGWIVSAILARSVAPVLPLPAVATNALVLLASGLAGVLATSVAIRPLGRVFSTRQGTRHGDLVGKVVRITTGRVDGSFGEGHLDDGGAGLQLQVRCADPDALARDDEALILGWNTQTETFEVEPMGRIDGTFGKPGRSATRSRNST